MGRVESGDLLRVAVAAWIVAALRAAGVFVTPVYGSLTGTTLAWAMGLGWLEPEGAKLTASRFFSHPVTRTISASVGPEHVGDFEELALTLRRMFPATVRWTGESVTFLCDLPGGSLEVLLYRCSRLVNLSRLWRSGELDLEELDLDSDAWDSLRALFLQTAELKGRDEVRSSSEFERFASLAPHMMNRSHMISATIVTALSAHGDFRNLTPNRGLVRSANRRDVAGMSSVYRET